MRPEEAGGFPDMTVKVKCYFGKCEKKIDKFRRLFFLHIHWNLVSILSSILIQF